MKAYKSLSPDDKSLRLFRPECNMERLSNSMHRLHFPCFDFDQEEFVKCIKELVKVDQDWIPEGEGYSLYVRPTVIATDPFLGLAEAKQVLLYVICSPVGPYYKTGFEPVRLTADSEFIRAWPGGTGGAKVGGNYAATMKAGAQANIDGYNQVLWLFPNEKDGENYVTEVGAMNVFFVIEKEDGQTLELITPPLSRGDILPGVTRRSILELERLRGEMEVSERDISMSEILRASKEGRLKEAFGAGTAAVVSPIECIQYKGEDINIDAPGTVTLQVWDEITSIQYGVVEGPEGWSVVID
jgi:branched-chain amino acid aminotransferase